MGSIILYIGLGLSAVVSIRKPWIGVVIAYFFSILGPQNIWWWHFEGVRHFFYIFIPVFLGFVLYFLSDTSTSISSLKTRINVYMAIIWLFISLSYFFGSYVDIPSQYRFHDPGYVFSLLNKIFIFYFIAVSLISDVTKVKWFSVIIVISCVYYIYWANNQYFLGNWTGRLSGPRSRLGGSIYGDENNFAMFFVTALPFIFYLGFYFKKLTIRIILWGIIPLGWHAIFLTASRGGLLGLIATMIIIVIRLKSKIFGVIIVLILFFSFLWQAGPVLKERAGTIVDYSEDESATTRIEAWRTVINIAKSHPFLGVGVASFGPAFPFFSDKQPRQAHNTIFQITAEWGIIAGGMYCLIFFAIFRGLWLNGIKLRQLKDINQDALTLYLINEATLVSFFGFSICSLFLSLQMFEIYYYLVILGNGILFVSKQN